MTDFLNLEPKKESFKPPKYRSKKYQPKDNKDNFEELNNEGHEIVTEDFSDSPFADRI